MRNNVGRGSLRACGAVAVAQRRTVLDVSCLPLGSGWGIGLNWRHRAVVQNFYLVVEYGVRGKYENLIISKKQSSSVDPGVCMLVCACVCACTDMHMCDTKSCFFIYPYPIVTGAQGQFWSQHCH